MAPPHLVVGHLSGRRPTDHAGADDRDLSARTTSRSSQVSPEAHSSPPVPTETSPAKPGCAPRPGVPSLGLGLSLGTDSLAHRVAQRRQLAAGLRSERRGSPKEEDGSLTATSRRARGADVPPEARISVGGRIDPSISPPRPLESSPRERSCGGDPPRLRERESSHSSARPQLIKLSERLPLLCTPTLPTPQWTMSLHKPPPSPRDDCAVHAIIASSSPSGGASPAAAAPHDAPAAEEHAAAAVATDDLRQLAARFWAGVAVVLRADESLSGAVAVGTSALSVTSGLGGFG